MEIVLGRVGHYFDAGNGSCSTAIVTDAVTATNGSVVNVAGWHSNGDPFNRTSVLVEASPGPDANSFHLTRDCPWSR